MLQRFVRILILLFSLFSLNAWSGNYGKEPIPYFERYKPTFFLIGKPFTKAQVSFQIQVIRQIPLNLAYTELFMWDLFRPSSPFRDLNYNPEVYYRIDLSKEEGRTLDIGIIDHESNGKAGPESRSWNRTYVRYSQGMMGKDRKWSWTLKAWVPYTIDDPTGDLLEHRGVWEFQIAGSSLLQSLFEVNELVLRIYAGGKSRLDPTRGGQELTYREKESSRAFLLPLYFQIFHGYGENQLDAGDNRWGLRAGIGF